jgi:hypothetical protein
MFSDWVSFLIYPNLFGIKDFVVVVEDNDLRGIQCVKIQPSAAEKYCEMVNQIIL